VAGSVHAVKSIAVRPVVTATTAGTGNVPVSILEDIIATVVSILSIVIPILFGLMLILMIALVILLVKQRRLEFAKQISANKIRLLEIRFSGGEYDIT